MTQTVRELMTTDPVTLDPSTSARLAAQAMRDHDVGVIVVATEGGIRGIITDRDIVIRAIAGDRDPSEVSIEEICTADLTVLTPDQPVDEAVSAMRAKGIRRVPVVEDGRPVGIVSLGDLAVAKDERSALAEISARPPDR